jgi:hypothetical protein
MVSACRRRLLHSRAEREPGGDVRPGGGAVLAGLELRRLVELQDARVFEQDPRNRQPL